MLADACLIAGKDLRIELRSKVGIGQMVPFAVLVLVLFGLALDPDPRAPLRYAYSPATGCLARAAGGGGGEPKHISVQPAVEKEAKS